MFWSMRGSVTVHMTAPADEIWAVVSDVTQIGKYSPETFEAEWLNGATGPALGACFRGHVKRNGRGPIYWTTCNVTACEPGREFAFTVGPADKWINSWGYKLVPAGSGTDVTEFFQLANKLPTRLYWALFGWARGKTNEKGMRQTLERIRAVVEAPSNEVSP
jgi:hypothetical protein